MKKLLLLIFLISFDLFINKSDAQCTFGNIGVEVNWIQTDPTGKCTVNLDFYFNIHHNPGGKYFWIHIWPTSLYPSAFNYNKPPTTSAATGGNSALDNSITTFGFFHQGGALDPLLSYPPDGAAPGFQSGYTLSEIEGAAFDRYTAHGLTITLPQNCIVAQSLTADAWESQSADAQNVHCVSRNQVFYLNDPRVNGLLRCPLPRTYFFDITTISPTNRNVDYEVRIDNGDGKYNQETDTLLIKSGFATISNSVPFTSGIQEYLPYSNQKPYSDKDLWVIVLKNATDLPNDIYAQLTNNCIPLPVKMASFTATRNKETVSLKWATATEENNKGFFIERKYGNDDWINPGYVPTSALNGNSDGIINYAYTDINSLTGVCLYRIKQISLDNKITYSDVRTVNGMGQSKKVIVFPNPSHNGQLNIVLDNLSSEATIKLINMNGSIVKEWNNVTAHQLNINNLPSGMYTLRIWDKKSDETVSVKVMVNK